MYGIIGFSDNFVPWFFGDEFLSVAKLMQITAPVIILISINTTIGNQYLVSINKQKIQSISVISGAICNVILNLLLINKYGAIGAIISSLFAEFIICALEIIYIRKYKDYKFSDIFCGFFKYMILGAIMCCVVYSVGLLLKPNIISTIIQVFVGILVYLILLLLTKDDLLKQYISKFRK